MPSPTTALQASWPTLLQATAAAVADSRTSASALVSTLGCGAESITGCSRGPRMLPNARNAAVTTTTTAAVTKHAAQFQYQGTRSTLRMTTRTNITGGYRAGAGRLTERETSSILIDITKTTVRRLGIFRVVGVKRFPHRPHKPETAGSTPVLRHQYVCVV